MGTKLRLRSLNEKIKLHGDEGKHEQTDRWSNRDLIPLPPHRRTWGWFNYFGYWAISSLSIGNWQQPNTFLTQGLSVRQAMMVIVVSRALITLFSSLIAWCGFTWHIGFTVQNRYSWGMRGSFLPLLCRILLNFIWTAYQCWVGGRLIAVALTAIWPSYATITNTFSPTFPTTTPEFLGFFLFWLISVPFLWMRPEKFKLPFQIVCSWCALGMLSMLIWSTATTKTLGPLFYTGQNLGTTSEFNVHWILMSCINQMLGGIAAGITNASDFSRYGRSPTHYLVGTIGSAWIVGTLVSFIGLVTTSCAQVKYGEVYWNPPDLLMVMMNSGHGSSKSRAGVFFLSVGFALTSMFENICGNAVAGGIDLAGLFPKYINIRRGAFITFVACWICQPWYLVNRATSFIYVMGSFSVFLAPMVGIMTVDFFVLRRRKVKLTHLYLRNNSPVAPFSTTGTDTIPSTTNTTSTEKQPTTATAIGTERTEKRKDKGKGDYWYLFGFNPRAFPAWTAGWSLTLGGLIVSVRGDINVNRVVYQFYYMAFLLGFFISASIFYVLNVIWPPTGLGEWDEVDYYGTFTEREAVGVGVVLVGGAEVEVGEGEGKEKRAGNNGEKDVEVSEVAV